MKKILIILSVLISFASTGYAADYSREYVQLFGDVNSSDYEELQQKVWQLTL